MRDAGKCDPSIEPHDARRKRDCRLFIHCVQRIRSDLGGLLSARCQNVYDRIQNEFHV